MKARRKLGRGKPIAGVFASRRKLQAIHGRNRSPLAGERSKRARVHRKRLAQRALENGGKGWL